MPFSKLSTKADSQAIQKKQNGPHPSNICDLKDHNKPNFVQTSHPNNSLG